MARFISVDETAVHSLEWRSQAVVIVGDVENTISNRLSELCEGDDIRLNITNRYYEAKVALLRFQSDTDFVKFVQDKTEFTAIGLLIIKFVSLEALDVILDSMFRQWVNPLSEVIVLDNEYDASRVKEWLQSKNQQMEVVILNPSQDTKEEASSLHEKWGFERLMEVLHTVEWPHRKDLMKKKTGRETVDRILQLISEMSDSSDDDDWEPDADNQKAIWDAFATCPIRSGVDSSSNLISGRNLSNSTVEATVTLDVTINNGTTEQAHAANTKQADEQTAKKKKKNKKKKMTTIELDSDESQQFDEKSSLSGLVDEELKQAIKGGGEVVIENLIAQVEGGMGDMHIGNLSKVREQLKHLDRAEQIEKAAVIVKGIMEQYGAGEADRSSSASSQSL